MATIYMVRRPFVYDGVSYGHGDTWQPLGFRTDKTIIKQSVIEVTIPDEPDPVVIEEPTKKTLRGRKR